MSNLINGSYLGMLMCFVALIFYGGDKTTFGCYLSMFVLLLFFIFFNIFLDKLDEKRYLEMMESKGEKNMKKILFCSVLSIWMCINAIDVYFTSRFVFDFIAILSIGYFFVNFLQYFYLLFCDFFNLLKHIKMQKEKRKKDERGMINE